MNSMDFNNSVLFQENPWDSGNWSGKFNPLFEQWPALKILIVTIYLLLLVGGVVANSVVVFLVLYNRRMLTVTNLFITNLALSDLSLCVFCLPLQLHYQLTNDWAFGGALCRVVFGSFAVPIGVSTLSLFLIALDRYWNIVCPLERRMTRRGAGLLILASGVVSVLLALPVVVFTSQRLLDEEIGMVTLHARLCIEEWPTDEGRFVYTVAMFLIQFSTPLALSATLYYRIYAQLRSRRRPRTPTSPRESRLHRTNRILIAIVAVFVVCWLPWNLWSLVTELGHTLVLGPYFELVDMLVKAFALASACVNPFLYCWLNGNFRRELSFVAVRLRLCGASGEGRAGARGVRLGTVTTMGEGRVGKGVRRGAGRMTV